MLTLAGNWIASVPLVNVAEQTVVSPAAIWIRSTPVGRCRIEPRTFAEINEGLNVVEQWNGATDFVFFARRGEIVSNRRED